MAGDWIKLEHSTQDKPELMQMAGLLAMEPERVLGHLVRVWCWADQQSLNGHALNVTEMDIDRVARHAGVASAMRKVGWLKGDDGCISFPKFERHNGESAKKRVLARRRKAEQRSRESHAESGTSSLSISKGLRGGVGEKRGTRFEATELSQEWAAYCRERRPDLDPLRTFERFRDYWIAKPGSGGLKLDWTATWRKWVSEERAGPKRQEAGQQVPSQFR